MTGGEPIVIERKMRPAYGYVEVSSLPEQNAIVFINDEKVGKTPFKSDKLPSGDYKVKVVKELYKSTEEIFTITDGNVTKAVLDMQPNYATLAVTTDPQADIYVDNVYKGKGSWNGKVEEGTHFVEARRKYHEPTSKNVTLSLGEDKQLTLDYPQPMMGILDVNSDPIRAEIFIDGQFHGLTPKIIEGIKCGPHNIVIKKEGYAEIKKHIVIEEKTMCSLNESLKQNKKEKIETPKTEKPKTEKPKEQKKDLESIYFGTANVAYSISPQLSYGYTLGVTNFINRLGFYFSMMIDDKSLTTDFECDAEGLVNDEVVYYNGETANSRYSAIGGILFRVADPLYLKAGIGKGERVFALQDVNERWIKHSTYSYSGYEFNAGLMFKLGDVIVSADAVTIGFETFEIKLGIGLGI